MYCINLIVQSQEEGVANDVKLTAGLKPGTLTLSTAVHSDQKGDPLGHIKANLNELVFK